MTQTLTVHATALVIGEAGVLLQGLSGAGKSAIALACIDAAQAQGRFARLVSDDRVCLGASNGRVVARAHPAIAGRIERRGLTICRTKYMPAAILRLVVGLGPERAAQRLPWLEPSATLIGGLSIAFLPLNPTLQRADQVALIFAALETWTKKG